jgi:hypothetical protein
VLTVNSKEETSYDFWLDFFQEFGLGTKKRKNKKFLQSVKIQFDDLNYLNLEETNVTATAFYKAKKGD